MTDTRAPARLLYDPAAEPDLYDGILAKRVVAFFIDAFLIVALLIPAALMVFVLGFITLGLAWLLYPLLFAIVALTYIAFTLGGPMSGTPGMRLVGVEMRTWNGQKMFPLLAVLHGLSFWISMGLLTPLVLVVGLLTYRKQLLHDLLLGVVALNALALRRDEKPIVE
jgi:uncharacterized RDD family membrane protein YckC